MNKYELREITKIDERSERVYAVACIWIETKQRTQEEIDKLCQAWRGDAFGRVIDTAEVEGKRHPRFQPQIVANLRFSNKELFEPYTDDQIHDAHMNWSISEDFPDEAKIVEWIE